MTEAIYQSLYRDDLPMKPVALILAALLILPSLLMLLQPKIGEKLLRAFPRNKTAGIILLALAAAWSWMMISQQDMGEFYPWRGKILLFIPIAFLLIVFFADEFLSVRALGCLLLLLAAPILKSAFLKDPWFPKLLLPTLAYAMIFKGLFYVGMPYLMRDAIDWVSKSSSRWNFAFGANILYGIILAVAAFLFY